MERLKIKAEAREVGKKGLNRRLRKGGSVPAILYGSGEVPVGLSVNSKDLVSKLKSAGLNALIDLELSGRSDAQPLVVMLKDYQTDSVRRTMTHVDLFKIDLTHKVTIKVPLKLIGKSVGLTKGGLIEQARRELEVNCLPGNIPEVIEVDITHLDLGHSIHVKELKLPEGVEVPHDETDFAIVSVVAPREEKVEEAPVAAEGAPAAAGAEGAAAPAPEAEKAEKEKSEKK